MNEMTRGVADLLTASGSTTITAVRMLKNLIPMMCWTVSTNLLHVYVLIARLIISN